MPADKRKLFNTLALWLLLLVALGLRLQQWNNIDLPDEAALVKMTLHLYDNPFPGGAYPGYPGYPPLILYLGFALSFVLQKVLLFLGIVQFPSQFVYSNLGFDFVLKTGRIVSALGGTMLVALAWRMGREFYGHAAAWFAALLMAINALLVFDAHIFKPDTLTALLLCASLYYALKHDRDGHWRWLVSSSFLFGLATAAKYNSAVELFFLLPLFFITCRRYRQPLWKPLLLAPSAMALGFFAGAPNWLVHPIMNIGEAYRFVTYHYSSFHFYGGKKLAYSAFFKTFLESFGPVLCVILVIGFIAIIFNRRRTDVIIAAYIIVYVAILGNTSYFGIRMVLPLLPAAALLMANGLFAALPRLLRRFKGLASAYPIVVWVLLAGFVVTGALGNIRRFNLLDTASTYKQAIDYRFRHIPFGYSLARENLTPGFSGDMGFSDLTSVPRQLFKGPNAMRFLCTGLFTRYILEETGNSPVRRKLKRYLIHYTPIERIRKPRFSSFDDDITYWYKKPDWVNDLNLDRPLPHLPVVFGLPPSELPSDTCFLPLQNFEKSALAGKIARDIWTKKIYSSRPLKRLVFYILPNGISQQLIIAVNGEKETFPLERVRQIRRIVFDHIRPRRLHDGCVYSIELATDATRQPIFLACMPEYASALEAAPEAALFDRPQLEPLPDLFSTTEAPFWCREVYRVAGVDPILQRFALTERLFSNFEQSTQDRVLDDFPLLAGRYLVRIKGKKIAATRPMTANLKLTWHAIGLSKKESGEFTFSPAEMESGIARPIAADELAFVQFGIEGQGPSNFLVDELSIEPDYLAYVNAYWLKK